jgi:hypothetical protein
LSLAVAVEVPLLEQMVLAAAQAQADTELVLLFSCLHHLLLPLALVVPLELLVAMVLIQFFQLSLQAAADTVLVTFLLAVLG